MRKGICFLLALALCWLPLAGIAALGEDQAVTFADPVLEEKVRAAIGIPEGPISRESAAKIDQLDLQNDDFDTLPEEQKIADLSGLEAFTNLFSLKLYGNRITDLSPLRGLMGLKYMDLGGNQISDLSPLEGHFILDLSLWGNRLSDLSPLEKVQGLERLALNGNQITDVSALASLATLKSLALGDNPIADYSPLKELMPQLQETDFTYIELRTPEDPTQVITFSDPVLEAKVRAAMGKPQGDITAADAATVRVLDLGSDWQPSYPEGSQIRSLEGLEAFLNLNELKLSFQQITDWTPLAG